MRQRDSRVGRLVAAWALAAGLCLAGAAPAWATVSSSRLSVVAPPDASYLVDNQITDDEQITVGGTTNGHAGDAVDIKCYSDDGSQTLAGDVQVDSDGSFQYTGSFRGISRQTCVLRAVPAGDSADFAPGSPSPYAGPVLNLDQVTETAIPSGPNAGRPEYYYLYVSQPAGAFEYASLGGCSISESYTYDPTTFGGLGQAASESLDYCNAWFSWENGGAPGTPAPTRSELQVDGVDAYVAGNAWALGGLKTANNSGYPSLTYSYSIDPATGDLALTETDEVVRCTPGGMYPPTSSSCPQFVPTGVQVAMHIVQGQSGRVASVVQSFASTDGAAHRVDLLEDNDFYHRGNDGQLDFPWTGAGMRPYTTAGQFLPGPSSSEPGTFFVKGSGGAGDGTHSSPQGEVTFSNPPSSVTIVGPTNNSQHLSWVELHYSLTLPPGGSVPLGFTYSNAFLAGQLLADAGAAQRAFRPAVSISAPPAGIVTARSTVLVSGSAADADGLSSLTVDGRRVPVAAGGGAWSAPVALRPGANSITVVATNLFGNTAQAQTTVLYVPPPAVSGLRQAHRRWREPGRRTRTRAPVGTSFAYTLSEAARVRFAFTQRLPGRRVGRSCVAETRRNRRRAPCLRTVARGAQTVTAGAGAHRFDFAGAVPGGRRLAPGTYTVTIVAITPSTGAQSRPARLTFTIVR